MSSCSKEDDLNISGVKQINLIDECDFNVQLDLTDEVSDGTSAQLNKQIAALTAKLNNTKSKFKRYRKELNARNEEVYNLREKLIETKRRMFGFENIKHLVYQNRK